MKFLTSLIRSPWAITEDLVPVVAGVLARIAAGKPISAADREYIDRTRASRFELEIEADDALPAPRAGARSGAKYTGNVAVIGIYGVLTQRGGMDPDTSEPLTSMSRLTSTIQSAAADPAIGSIVLDVDSPGGSVNGVQELADAIFAARKQKPVAAIANSLAASAAYWCASQAGEVYAAPGAETGSIGCYTVFMTVMEALKNQGVSIELIRAGKYKAEGNPYEPLSPEGRAHVQGMVNTHYDSFVRAVARGRGKTLAAVREGMGQGRTLLPDDAKAAGMIDGTMTLEQLIGKMTTRLARSGGSSARALMQQTVDLAELGQVRPAARSQAARPTRAQLQREIDILLLS